MFNIVEFLIALFAFIGQLGVVYLTGRMITFASQYGKPWALAFKFFFMAMSICALRRGAVVLLAGGIESIKDSILFWDRFVSNPILSGLYLIFLFILVGWWKKFFDNLNAAVKTREQVVSKREEAIKLKEQLIMEEPNGVEVYEPQKVIIEVGEKKVFADHPKKVIVVNPKNIIETEGE